MKPFPSCRNMLCFNYPNIKEKGGPDIQNIHIKERAERCRYNFVHICDKSLPATCKITYKVN